MNHRSAYAFFGLTLLILGFGGVVFGVVNEIVEQRLGAILKVQSAHTPFGLVGLAFGFAAIIAGCVLMIQSDHD